ncbi:hypothetical protein XFF6991_4916 [Xanthomonas phaseoli pv. phaseoli]|uniref:Uncharacterized protein n=2 Tax=Xanthomonas campestris pv. phaseoli TaxID=317013 RepID=A0A7Z7IXE8_XANCH|nr:hypothetical protein XFF6991_4916 [Xanthomonas phaseoli pv. phaseoli]
MRAPGAALAAAWIQLFYPLHDANEPRACPTLRTTGFGPVTGKKKPRQCRGFQMIGVPTGIRTPVSTVKGWCPRPLDDGDAYQNLVVT